MRHDGAARNARRNPLVRALIEQSLQDERYDCPWKKRSATDYKVEPPRMDEEVQGGKKSWGKSQNASEKDESTTFCPFADSTKLTTANRTALA